MGIEYSSSSLEKNLGIKAETYAAVGIPEYWVVNLQENKPIVFQEPLDQRYQLQQEWLSGEIHPLAFPGMAIEVKRLLG